jgi:hypothetical protein
MLTLTGTIEAAVLLPSRIDKKTGEVIPAKPVLQVKGKDHRGLMALFSLNVPSIDAYAGREGETITVPVRAWAPGASVSLAFEG